MSEFFTPSAGNYNVQVVNCEEREGKRGPYVYIGYKITDGENAWKYINDFQDAPGGSREAFTVAVLKALGWSGGDPGAVVGKKTTVTVKTKPRNDGGMFVNVYPQGWQMPGKGPSEKETQRLSFNKTIESSIPF